MLLSITLISRIISQYILNFLAWIAFEIVRWFQQLFIYFIRTSHMMRFRLRFLLSQLMGCTGPNGSVNIVRQYCWLLNNSLWCVHTARERDPSPRQIPRTSTQNPMGICVVIGLYAVWTPLHNPIQSIFYRSRSPSRCRAVWIHH